MKKFATTGLIALALTTAACNKQGAEGKGELPAASEELMKLGREQFKALPASVKDIPGFTASAELIDLGSMLFHDPRLSGSHALSCASCHNIGLGGGDDASTSIGHNWQQGGRNAPTVLNATFNFAQFWDGRAKDLFEQAGGPMVNPIEMNSPKDHIVEQIKSIPGYADAFAKAFPGQKDPITLENVQKAIAAFETTLITPNAPFDQYLNGKADALDPAQKEGFKLFVDTGCASCHNGMNVGGGMYAKFGIASDPDPKYRPVGDVGRMKVTNNPADKYVYKVPTLRNIALTAPYFHTGSAWDLREAVKVMAKTQLGKDLNDADADKIVAFLGTLSGEQPNVRVPILPASNPNTSRPVRD